MAKYKIKSQIIDDLYDKAEEIHANISLIEMFCREYYNVDDFYKVKALLKRTYNLSDKLYVDMINIKG